VSKVSKVKVEIEVSEAYLGLSHHLCKRCGATEPKQFTGFELIDMSHPSAGWRPTGWLYADGWKDIGGLGLLCPPCVEGANRIIEDYVRRPDGK